MVAPGVHIPDDEVADLRTVGDILERVVESGQSGGRKSGPAVNGDAFGESEYLLHI